MSAAAATQPQRPILRVRGLTLRLPDGRALFDQLDLEVAPGEIVVILGGSGAGKSTLARVLFDRERLLADGFTVESAELACDAPLGLVPQRGALFDHLDVAGNLELALRRSPSPPSDLAAAVRQWLGEVDLPAELADGAPVTRLSGGQGQRLAVARTLAGGRSVLFLDEPSVGLDPYRVDGLARLVRQQCDQRGAAAIVVTHDLALAVGVADRLLVLDAETGQLTPLLGAEAGAWPGPFVRAGASRDLRAHWQAAAEKALTERLAAPTARAVGTGRAAPMVPRGRFARRLLRLLRPFQVAATAIIGTPREISRFPGDFLHVFGRAWIQAFARPAAFYAVVATLLGFTVLYVISHTAPVGVRAEVAIDMVGGSYIVALTPPVAGFLFVAASGSATNAWLGGMGLTRQIAALEALGVSRERYLWAPVYCALALSFVLVALLFAAGLLAGGLILCKLQGVAGGWQLLGRDLLEPRPERLVYSVRALWLVGIYALGIAADVVAKGSADKDHADEVTKAMTSSVVASTLWVVALELVSAFALFAAQGGR